MTPPRRIQRDPYRCNNWTYSNAFRNRAVERKSISSALFRCRGMWSNCRLSTPPLMFCLSFNPYATTSRLSKIEELLRYHCGGVSVTSKLPRHVSDPFARLLFPARLQLFGGEDVARCGEEYGTRTQYIFEVPDEDVAHEGSYPAVKVHVASLCRLVGNKKRNS